MLRASFLLPSLKCQGEGTALRDVCLKKCKQFSKKSYIYEKSHGYWNACVLAVLLHEQVFPETSTLQKAKTQRCLGYSSWLLEGRSQTDLIRSCSRTGTRQCYSSDKYTSPLSSLSCAFTYCKMVFLTSDSIALCQKWKKRSYWAGLPPGGLLSGAYVLLPQKEVPSLLGEVMLQVTGWKWGVGWEQSQIDESHPWRHR